MNLTLGPAPMIVWRLESGASEVRYAPDRGANTDIIEGPRRANS